MLTKACSGEKWLRELNIQCPKWLYRFVTVQTAWNYLFYFVNEICIFYCSSNANVLKYFLKFLYLPYSYNSKFHVSMSLPSLGPQHLLSTKLYQHLLPKWEPNWLQCLQQLVVTLVNSWSPRLQTDFSLNSFSTKRRMSPRYAFNLSLILKSFVSGSYVHCGWEWNSHPPFDYSSWQPLHGPSWTRSTSLCHPRTIIGCWVKPWKSSRSSSSANLNSSITLPTANSSSNAASSPGNAFGHFVFLKIICFRWSQMCQPTLGCSLSTLKISTWLSLTSNCR